MKDELGKKSEEMDGAFNKYQIQALIQMLPGASQWDKPESIIRDLNRKCMHLLFRTIRWGEDQAQ